MIKSVVSLLALVSACSEGAHDGSVAARTPPSSRWVWVSDNSKQDLFADTHNIAGTDSLRTTWIGARLKGSSVFEAMSHFQFDCLGHRFRVFEVADVNNGQVGAVTQLLPSQSEWASAPPASPTESMVDTVCSLAHK